VVNGRTLPKNAIDKWPEVFGEITCNVVPLTYLHTITITFKNAKVWEIRANKIMTDDWDSFESHIKEVIKEYESNIESIDFQLDTDRIKKDITKHTKRFLDKRKLK
jgi:hypothetical protein